MQLSIIIVNYNVKYFLEQCLLSVIKACEKINAEIIVVDNNSTDGSQEFFKRRFEEVEFIWNDQNMGFGKANNLAVKQALGTYILFLNPDTIIPEDCFEKCLAVFSSKKELGALGIKMIDGSGCYLKESKRAFPSPLTSLYKLAGLTALFPRSALFARYYLGNLDENTDHDVDVLAGAFMMTAKKILDAVGGFDEVFFMYGEDIDLSYRIRKAGYKNLYFAGSTIIHFKGESTKKRSLKYTRVFYGAMCLFVDKHYNKVWAFLYKLVIHSTILILSLFGGIRHLFTRLFSAKKNETERRFYVIVANTKEFQTTRSILLNIGTGAQSIHSIATGNAEKTNADAAPGDITLLQEQMENLQANEIIFCSNGYLVKNIIATIEELGPVFNYKFHLEGSLSIVGSNSKDSAGDVFAIHGPVTTAE